MRLLLINGEIQSRASEIIKNAEFNPFTMDDLLDIKNNQAPVPGDLENYTMFIPDGFKVVYTLEEQNVGRMKHMSVSVNTPGAYPSIPHVEEIMKLFKFNAKDVLDLYNVTVEVPGESGACIHLLELI